MSKPGHSAKTIYPDVRLTKKHKVLSIGIVILRKTQIPLQKKIILLSIFSATILVIVIALVRVVINTSLNTNNDISWLYFWSGVEMGVGQLLRHLYPYVCQYISHQSLTGKSGSYPDFLHCLIPTAVRHIKESAFVQRKESKLIWKPASV